MPIGDTEPWKPVRIQLVVTGHAEEKCVPGLIGKIFKSAGKAIHPLKVLRTDQRPRMAINDLLRRRRGVPHAVVPLRQHLALVRQLGQILADPTVICLLFDDMEQGERGNSQNHFNYFRDLLNSIPVEATSNRVSVHFLVNMLEAYFFADVAATNTVFKGLNLRPHNGDVENIRHPKDELSPLISKLGEGHSYKETEHGPQIFSHLNLETILANPNHCRALRTLVAWCYEAIGEPRTERFCLTNGTYWAITSSQLSETPPHVDPLGEETAYCPLAS